MRCHHSLFQAFNIRGALPFQNGDYLKVFVKMPFEIWPMEKKFTIKIQIDLTPSFFFLTKPAGVGPYLYLVFKQFFVECQVREE